MSQNGRLRRSELAPITRAVNGEQAYLRADAARAFNAMNAESERRFGVTLRVSTSRVAYRTLAEQEHFWREYKAGRGALAAVPGTSNHGLGLAVDLATPQMRRIVDRIGRKYGWAKAWSDAPSEWWHLKWRPGRYRAVRRVDPLVQAGFSALMRSRIRRLDDYRRRDVRKSARHVLERLLRAALAREQRAAKRHGMTRARRRRIASLKARTS